MQFERRDRNWTFQAPNLLAEHASLLFSTQIRSRSGRQGRTTCTVRIRPHSIDVGQQGPRSLPDGNPRQNPGQNSCWGAKQRRFLVGARVL